VLGERKLVRYAGVNPANGSLLYLDVDGNQLRIQMLIKMRFGQRLQIILIFLVVLVLI
jgi:hypothetical protein